MNLSVFSFLGNCCVHQMCVFFLARRSSCWCAAAPSVTTDCRAQQRPAGCTQDARSAQKKPPIMFDFLWKQFLRFFQIFSLVWLYSKTASHFQNIRSRLYYSRMLMVASKKDVWISEYELLLLGHFEQTADCPPSENLCTKKISTFARCVCTLWCGGARALSFSPGFQSPNMRLFVHSARSQG